LAYNLSAFKVGDEIEISLKLHGTSQRTAHLPVFKKMKRTFWQWLREEPGKPIYNWGYVSGTRRVVLENYEGGFYGSNEFREEHSKRFEGKLLKGETIYYEVVSFTTDGTPIMGQGKVPTEAQAQYGKTMVFHYGREEGSDIYVYRMTMTNPDGEVVEYTPDFMRYRCEQMAVKCVPVFGKIILSADRAHFVAPDGYDHDYLLKEGMTLGDLVMKIAEEYYDGPDPIGKTHVREGVVVRILNRPKFTAYKHKNFLFKQITGIIKESDTTTNIQSEDILAEM
jgi:hypothetical protein